MLLEGNNLAAVQRQHVSHLHNSWISGSLVLPHVVPKCHDGVTIGEELFGHHGEVITDFPESHKHPFEHSLRTDVRASERKPIGLGPPDVLSHGAEDSGDIAGCEARIDALNDFLVSGHYTSPLPIGRSGQTAPLHDGVCITACYTDVNDGVTARARVAPGPGSCAFEGRSLHKPPGLYPTRSYHAGDSGITWCKPARSRRVRPGAASSTASAGAPASVVITNSVELFH